MDTAKLCYKGPLVESMLNDIEISESFFFFFLCVSRNELHFDKITKSAKLELLIFFIFSFIFIASCVTGLFVVFHSSSATVNASFKMYYERPIVQLASAMVLYSIPVLAILAFLSGIGGLGLRSYRLLDNFTFVVPL